MYVYIVYVSDRKHSYRKLSRKLFGLLTNETVNKPENVQRSLASIDFHLV